MDISERCCSVCRTMQMRPALRLAGLSCAQAAPCNVDLPRPRSHDSYIRYVAGHIIVQAGKYGKAEPSLIYKGECASKQPNGAR